MNQIRFLFIIGAFMLGVVDIHALYKSVTLDSDTNLSAVFPSSKLAEIDSLKISGDLSNLNIRFINQKMKVRFLDLSDASLLGGDDWTSGDLPAAADSHVFPTILNGNVFYFKTQYKHIILPRNILYITSDAFNYMMLTEVTFGPNVQKIIEPTLGITVNYNECSIGKLASGNKGYLTIHIDKDNAKWTETEDHCIISNDGSQLDYVNPYLSAYYIPQTVSSVAQYAIYDGLLRKSNIKDLHMHKDLTSIASEAFYFGSSSAFSRLFVYSKIPQTIPFQAFNVDKNKVIVNVPKGCKDDYEWNPYWGNWPLINEFDSESAPYGEFLSERSIEISNDDEIESIHNIAGIRLQGLQSGINIVRYKSGRISKFVK